MHRRLLVILAAGLLVLAGSTFASGQTAPPPPARPKIGLALGGGGARGMAHIGVIRALEQLHIPIDYVAGTSMGSIIGGLYACGFTPDEMEKLIKAIKWSTLFEDAPERAQQSFRQKEDDFDHLIPLEFGVDLKGLKLPPGLVAGSKLGFVLQSATLPCSTVANFDDFRIPFRAVATDIQTGQPYVMSSGNLARVMRASMAIPAIFTPGEIDGHVLIDGGESENLPVQTVRAMGADIVIAVNVGSSGAEIAAKPTNVGAMIGRLIDLPLQQNTMESARLATLVITPDLKGYTSADFLKGAEMIPLGYKAAMADQAKLEAWSEPESVFGTWKQGHDAPLAPLPFIDDVVVEPVPNVDPRRIEYLVQTKPGAILDTKVLGGDLKRIYAMGIFEIVSYAITRENERNVLRITATPKSWGPTYLQLGLSLATDFQFATEFGVVALINATELNGLGAQWKTTLTIGSPLDLRTRFFQPLTYKGRIFASPYGFWNQRQRLAFIEGDSVGTYQVTRGGGGFDLGYDFGTWGELRAGYGRGYGIGTRKVGIPVFPDFRWDEGVFVTNFEIDQLDNVNLPHSGYFANVNFIAGRPSLGDTYDYNRFEAGAIGVQTIDRWSGLLKVVGGSGLGTDVPVYNEFFLGGLFRLSGRPQEQLSGNTYALATALLYYRLTKTGGAILKNVSVGVSIEGGNTWAYQAPVSFSGFKSAGSVFVVADTLIGPFFIGYGHSGSFSSAYLYLNRAF